MSSAPPPIPELVPAISGWRASRSTETLQRTFSDPDFDDREFLPIEVPAHWQTQPGFEDYDGTLLYRADVHVPALQPGQRRWLRFNGLCYNGDVFLDGVYVGQTEGYFTHHRFEVTDLLAESGASLLAVEVGASHHTPGEPKRSITGWFGEPPGAAESWNPAGIWQQVSIIDTGPVAIRHFRTDLHRSGRPASNDSSPRRAALDPTRRHRHRDHRGWGDRDQLVLCVGRRESDRVAGRGGKPRVVVASRPWRSADV